MHMYMHTILMCIYIRHAQRLQVLDLQSVDPALRGFNGGFVHNGRVYFVPFYTGVAAGSKLVSVDATSFSAASVQVTSIS
jgi:hypothetical protein